MSARAAKVFNRNLGRSPQEIQRALKSFSASASAFTLTKEEALEKYRDKWIAIYGGQVEAVGDTLEQLASQLATKHIPASETLFRRIDAKEKVFIL